MPPDAVTEAAVAVAAGSSRWRLARRALAAGLAALPPLAGGPALAGGVDSDLETIGEEAGTLASKKPGDADWLIFPIPVSSPSAGAGLVLAGVVFYNPNGAPDPWISGIGGITTENGTRGVGAFHSMSLDGDRIRVRLIGAYGNTKPKYYGIGADAGDRDRFVRLDERDLFVRLQAQFRAGRHFYLGGRAEYHTVDSRLDDATEPPADIVLPDLGTASTLVSVGPVLSYDSRDDGLNPRKGLYATAFMTFNLKNLGSDFSHHRLQLAMNGYRAVGSATVLAARASLCTVSSGGPYYDLCKFGAGNDLRGYTAGRYRDRASWAVQMEVRQHLAGRFGATAFAGIGGIAPAFGALGSRLLPGAGAGLRYLVSRSNNVNLRIDFAVGRHSKGLYVGLGEAF